MGNMTLKSMELIKAAHDTRIPQFIVIPKAYSISYVGWREENCYHQARLAASMSNASWGGRRHEEEKYQTIQVWTYPIISKYTLTCILLLTPCRM